jgi:6-pyruvoyltetrahydropterin/6-carboxytetrahydropterin synthase
MSRPRFTLRFAKADFKFSAAHFTIFGALDAEALHGHNYRVRAEVAGEELDQRGLLAASDAVKRRVRELCAELDDRVLLPGRSPDLEIREEADAVEVRFGERGYRFPAAEVVQLPLVNVTMELLARMLWRKLADDLRRGRSNAALTELAVEVEETEGQSCRYSAPLASP